MPSIGTLHRYSPPTGPNIRVDSGVAQGGEVGVHYDAMLAKLIVWGVCRTEARLRLAWALDRFIVLGVKTNIEFLRNLTAHPDFRSGNFHAQFLDDRPIITDREAPPEDALIAAAVTASQAGCRARGVASTDGRPAHNNAGPWRLGHAWRVS
jgi:acetyl/propionyl-CoA carboxylase alpha subunit